ncbi:MAG TPA: hypothetical protein PLA77_02725 [Bacteroidales bacterium]|nr:hypothetical protein [Bacteroidales bacterium]
MTFPRSSSGAETPKEYKEHLNNQPSITTPLCSVTQADKSPCHAE